jgi:hypothetical protein
MKNQLRQKIKSIPTGTKIIPCTCMIDAPFRCPQHGNSIEWREGREQMKRRATTFNLIRTRHE